VAAWIAFTHQGQRGFGRLEGDRIAVHSGDMFGAPQATGETLARDAVTLDMPCRPSKLIALWNNFGALSEKLGLQHPPAPLFLLKPQNTYRPSGVDIAIPAASEKILFEGELAIVIGKAARDLSEEQAPAHIFGYTCINDVTAANILKADASFDQWCRSKGLDGFGPFGPVIETELDVAKASVRTVLNGTERQNYPLSDMLMPPAKLVAMISQGMTLEPGDLIACGTSVGVGSIPKGATVEVTIDGIGTLVNRFI
jgi:2-keto-4-pentenoate hydratase/2-oxohepta-3-ene-1,7-dioic acid hydratase in catechol pathway